MLGYKTKFFIVICIILITGNISINETYRNMDNNLNYHRVEEEFVNSAFSKEDYSPLIEKESQGLGNITVNNIYFDEEGFFNNPEDYPNLNDDLISGAFNETFLGINYTETKSVAKFNNLANNDENTNIITTILNESIFVQYDALIPDSEGYLVYKTRLFPCKLIQFLMLRNGSSTIEEVPNEDYNVDDSNFLVFNYLDFFEKTRNNFTMYLLWEYNFTIEDWLLYQNSENNLLIDQKEQEVSALFHYNLSIRCRKFDGDSLVTKVDAENLEISVKLNPPDKELLYDHQLEINYTIANNFLNIDNSVNISTSGERLPVMLNFTANFTVKFIDPIERSWAIDRLVKNRNERERIYIPSLTQGPKHILLKYLMIYEETIILDQVLTNSSIFDRNVLYFDLNLSTIEESLKESLIFTKNAIKKQGLKIILPFLLVGETVPFIIKYDANNDLIVKVTDNINMPLVDVEITLFYYQKQYGTYISNDLVLPMSPLSTNENGEAIIRHVPNGDYTIRIYKDGKIIKQGLVTTYQEINFIITDEVHFPLVILIFFTINGIFVLLGYILYIQYKKQPNAK